ncbi:nitrilase-related carbon-nitrogen hydrolase, partial [Pseudomonas sp. TSPC2-1]
MLSPLGHSGPDQSPQKLKIACIQFEPKFGEVEHNVTRSIDLIEQAAGYGARLIVLPELCSTGYIFQSREETLALSERVPEGPTTNAWVEAARRLEVTIVAGLVERDG